MTEASLHEPTITISENLEKELLEESAALTHDEVAEVRDHVSKILDLEAHPQDAEYTGASLYYDASTMASLNPIALAALNRFRAYKPPPFPIWDTLPARKRAAVLILLFADRWGDLRVVVTMRAATLRNFSGHAALPGGKADSVNETPYQIARREAYEEIGLPMEDSRIPKPFRIEQLCSLPPAMARTHIVVTPCVAFLHADQTSPESPPPLVEESMIPRLDAREVAAVFSAPFYNFLKMNDLPPHAGEVLPPGQWYEGFWIDWEGFRWRSHNYYVPVNNQRVSKPRRGSATAAERSEPTDKLGDEQEDESRFRVWGMTGRVLLDAARIAYQEEPEMDHNRDFGDGEVIQKAVREGLFDEVGNQRKEEHNKPAKM